MRLPVLMVCLLSMLSVTAAEVYRWTDQNGRVHYGERPPPAGGQRIDLPEAVPGNGSGGDEIARRRERERRLLESYDYERAQKKARQAREATAQQETAQQCRELQQYWQRLSYPGPLFITRDDGERDYLDEQRRAAEKARVRPAYVRACGRQP